MQLKNDGVSPKYDVTQEYSVNWPVCVLYAGITMWPVLSVSIHPVNSEWQNVQDVSLVCHTCVIF